MVAAPLAPVVSLGPEVSSSTRPSTGGSAPDGDLVRSYLRDIGRVP
ncbi:MAG: RNA polymerase sigma factor, RpoD/SigA family, partial [Cyanobacteria bacterium M_surface_7_m2_040]|nr:RNA polymerase sigma factor, RpoD/SigA family [Cyanobacteria bacterium M_surface_7_m2_040]